MGFIFTRGYGRRRPESRGFIILNQFGRTRILVSSNIQQNKVKFQRFIFENKMLRLSSNCWTATLEKLRTCVTPLVVQVRFRYWADRKPVLRRWGFDDKVAWRGPLPRLPTGYPLPMPPYAPKNAWSEKKALFGQNDYIDILGDGSIHPVKISYNIPSWLRGFKGNELQMLVRKRKHIGHRLASSNPEAYKSMEKRMRFLYKVFNYRKKALMTREFAIKP